MSGSSPWRRLYDENDATEKGGSTGLRSERIRKMHKMLQGTGDVSLKRFLARCSYDMGLTRKTSRNYLQDLVDLGFIEIDETIDLIREVAPEGVEE